MTTVDGDFKNNDMPNYTKDLHHTNQEAHNQNENKSLFPIIHYTILYAGGKNF